MKKVKCVSAQNWEDLTIGKNYDVLKESRHCLQVVDDDGYTDWFYNSNFEIIKDSVVDSVIEQFKERSETGISKYGTTMDRKDLSPLQWLIELQQELMDGVIYAERLKKDMQNGK